MCNSIRWCFHSMAIFGLDTQEIASPCCRSLVRLLLRFAFAVCVKGGRSERSVIAKRKSRGVIGLLLCGICHCRTTILTAHNISTIGHKVHTQPCLGSGNSGSCTFFFLLFIIQGTIDTGMNRRTKGQRMRSDREMYRAHVETTVNRRLRLPRADGEDQVFSQKHILQ